LLYDQRGDGKIPVSQIGDVMRALGQNPTESEVKKLVVEHRADDRVTFEVFLPIMQAICSRRSTDTSDDFIEGLRHFDKDGNGFISSAELRHLLTTLGEKLSDEEAEQLLAGHEDNKVAIILTTIESGRLINNVYPAISQGPDGVNISQHGV